MYSSSQPVELTDEEREELRARWRARSLRASDATRARLILLLADGVPYRTVADKLGCSQTTVSLWRERFLESRLEGLYGRHRGSRASASAQRLEARILALTQKPPSDGSTHWTTRKLGRALGVSHMRVARVWSRAGLKPHRLERYVASNDPDFEAKAADVIALYVNPPQHAVVFSVDEKTALQALDRTLPVLPLSPGRAERHGFEYVRRGTLSLYAALNTRTGQVMGKTVASHTSEEFVAFLAAVAASRPPQEEIHIILDNLSAHKTKRVGEFLGLHPNVRLHFTPTYSSWLNQVELWLSKIERDVIARGIFTSTSDMTRKLMRYIREHNKTAKPIKWKYIDVTRRLRAPHSAVTVH
jgi:transposase